MVPFKSSIKSACYESRAPSAQFSRGLKSFSFIPYRRPRFCATILGSLA